MKFAYENLSDTQFENLIVLLCQKLLGISVQGFTPGPDGGRDAKFVGTAELHPSKAAPWVGTTIVQCKHTNGYNRSFSEPDFFSPKAKKTVIGDELPRIKQLRANKQLDHYMLFSNRRLAGNTESVIRKYISDECGLPESSIYLCDVEQLDRWLKVFRDVPPAANLDPVDSPLIVSPDDLAEVVHALARQTHSVGAVADEPPTNRVSYNEKNRLNGMTAPYARDQRKRYLKDEKQIRSFLAAPENIEIMRRYESVTEEFQLRIIAQRRGYQSFDQVMEYLAELLFGRDADLRQHRRLTRAVLFYMYWHCDIGEAEDAQAD